MYAGLAMVPAEPNESNGRRFFYLLTRTNHLAHLVQPAYLSSLPGPEAQAPSMILDLPEIERADHARRGQVPHRHPLL